MPKPNPIPKQPDKTTEILPTEDTVKTQNNMTDKTADLDITDESIDELKTTEDNAIKEDSENAEDSDLLDLSDPNAYELMIDNNPEDDSRLQNAQKRFISIDISNQHGVTRHGNYIVLPGRVSLILITLLLILFSVIGMSFGFIHFSVMAPNYLLSFAILQIILFIQITLYHSAYRAQRLTVSIIVTLVTILVMGIVDFFFFDLMLHPKRENAKYALLLIATVGFTSIPVLMFTHLIFLGRGSRTVAIRKKKTAADIPTKIIPTEAEKPTKIIKQ